MSVFLVRLFYLQIIRYDHYRQSANAGHLKEYQIPANRGTIKAYNGNSVVPIVLNHTQYTVYADPKLVKQHSKVADTLAQILGGEADSYEKKLRTPDARYIVLARKVTKEQQQAILDKKYPGVGTQKQPYRTYPNGSLAAQLLGFVNDEGKGVYGIEQALNHHLGGVPGQLKAVTDVHGVPLAANTDNILKQPESGNDVVLTIDIAMQKHLEEILKKGLERARSDSGNALILDANSGAVKAMANWPAYDPAQYSQVEDPAVFTNSAVAMPLEIGSVMKPLTAAAAMDAGAVRPDSSFYDRSSYKIDDATVKNIEEDGGPGVKNITDILDLSLNTGAAWLLMKMGGSDDQITKKGRQVWHDYMVNHFRFGKPTGIEQGYEAEGLVPDPEKGYARNLVYANTAFGQAMTATPLQMAAAFAAAVNGGKYYAPRLVDHVAMPDGKTIRNEPKVLKDNVVSPEVSKALRPMLEHVVSTHYFERRFDQNTYAVGGKTGTAQIADPEGGYLASDYNGTYVGFVGGDKPQYVIMVSVNRPKIAGYAGSRAAQPLFGDLAHMLIDKFNITPKNNKGR